MNFHGALLRNFLFIVNRQAKKRESGEENFAYENVDDDNGEANFFDGKNIIYVPYFAR